MSRGSRERILARIRRESGPAVNRVSQVPPAAGTGLPSDPSRVLAVFEENCRSSGTLLRVLDDPSALGAAVLERLDRLGAGSVLVFPGDVPAGDAVESLGREQPGRKGAVTLRFAAGREGEGGSFDKRDLARVDACVTGCLALAAEGGVCIVDSAAAPGRLGSLLPPHHIVVARRSQLSMSLDEAFGKLGGQNTPAGSAVVLISGPSRTADIEKELVIGVHGPVTLTVFLLP